MFTLYLLLSTEAKISQALGSYLVRSELLETGLNGSAIKIESDDLSAIGLYCANNSETIDAIFSTRDGVTNELDQRAVF